MPGPDESVLVVVRPAYANYMSRPMFVYVEDRFLGVLPDSSWIARVVPPGRQEVWLDWSGIGYRMDLKPGTVHYFGPSVTGLVVARMPVILPYELSPEAGRHCLEMLRFAGGDHLVEKLDTAVIGSRASEVAGLAAEAREALASQRAR